jgi:hypothetical protein
MEDLMAERTASFITRIRISMECYMRGLWASLLAAPAEIVHDASGKQPTMLIEKVTRIVLSRVHGFQGDQLDPPKLSDGRTIVGFMNSTAHSTAYFLAFAFARLEDGKFEIASSNMRAQVSTLRRIESLLREGKSRKEVIAEIRGKI